MSTNPFSFPDAALDAFSNIEHQLKDYYANNVASSLSDSVDVNVLVLMCSNSNVDNIFLDLPGAPDSLFNLYHGIDWSIYKCYGPFTVSPTSASDNDNLPGAWSIRDEPFPRYPIRPPSTPLQCRPALNF